MVWRLDLPSMVILFHGSQQTDREDQAFNHFILIDISPYSKTKMPSKERNLGELICRKELK
jgi:hypothetical protein